MCSLSLYFDIGFGKQFFFRFPHCVLLTFKYGYVQPGVNQIISFKLENFPYVHVYKYFWKSRYENCEIGQRESFFFLYFYPDRIKKAAWKAKTPQIIWAEGLSSRPAEHL